MPKNIFFCSLLFILSQAAFCADEPPLSIEEFLKRARHPPAAETWALMRGAAEHKRVGKDSSEVPIRLGIQFSPERTRAALKLGAKEGYVVGQPYDETPATILPTTPVEPAKSILANFGLRPEDLTMTFLFWKFKKEYERESVKGQKCRVLDMTNPQTNENAKVFISEQYYFPVKVEWTRSGENTPYRTLEVSELKRENDFWTVGELLLYGPGWKTRITFDDNKVGDVKDMPKDLIMDANDSK